MMPRSERPSFRSLCCSEAMNPRKIFPAPKWSQTGASAVFFSLYVIMREGYFCRLPEFFVRKRIEVQFHFLFPSALHIASQRPFK